MNLEQPIFKGAGQYRVVIGYADAVGTVAFKLPGSYVQWQDYGEGTERRVTYSDERDHCLAKSYLIEAKTTMDNPMDIMRQMKTYGQFFTGRLILWCESITDQQKKIFESQQILVSKISCP